MPAVVSAPIAWQTRQPAPRVQIVVILSARWDGIIPEGDRIVHVAVKLSSIVAELRKNIGDPVEKNDVVAVLESREVAEAKSEYLAARLTSELQQELFERDKALWDKRVLRSAPPNSSKNRRTMVSFFCTTAMCRRFSPW